jgi:hypothetical protein
MPGRPETKSKTETQNKVPSQLKNYNGQYADLHEVHDIFSIAIWIILVFRIFMFVHPLIRKL